MALPPDRPAAPPDHLAAQPGPDHSAQPEPGRAGQDPTAGPVGFDLDLTLIDSRSAILTAWSEVAAETGVEVGLKAVEGRLGVKLEDEIPFWFPATQAEAVAAAYRRHYVRLASSLTTALPGASQALDAVRDLGQTPVVITAKHLVSVGPSLKAAGLTVAEVYAHVHGLEKGAVLTRLRAVAYVGDTPQDIAAGRSAGVQAVGVPTGSFTEAELLAAGADTVLSSLLEFPAWYADFRRGSGRSAPRPAGR
ncbi:MAG TPA: HAD hydrolase-like protein [Streptosporangiaceae bacterium]